MQADVYNCHGRLSCSKTNIWSHSDTQEQVDTRSGQVDDARFHSKEHHRVVLQEYFLF